jgi:predicted DCC family thiol-disulfide oxidoreductase YuxK
VAAQHDGTRWTVLYDADCELCMWLLATLLRRDRARRLRPLALQHPQAGELLADLSPEQRLQSWHLISPAGERLSAGAAVPAVLGLLPYGRAPAHVLARASALTELGYRWVAEHRTGLSGLVPRAAKARACELVRARERAGDAAHS